MVPIVSGFWTSWLPFALPQVWPFCWWVTVAVDHFSRRVMGVGIWKATPTSVHIRHLLGRTMAQTGQTPKYLICDKARQFWNDGFKRWCKRKGIRPRFGAVGQHGSIAIVERLIRTVKDIFRGVHVPFQHDAMRQELRFVAEWYKEHRPHSALAGRTPEEVYRG